MKTNVRQLLAFALGIGIFLCQLLTAQAQTTTVGSGSYTNTFPGTDVAGRNAFPPGAPQLSGAAIGKPVPTNDWWSALIRNDHADNLFNYPMTMKTTNQGLVVTYIPWGVIDDIQPIVVGTSGLSTTKTTVSDYSDWTVTMHWKDASHDFKATSGIGMPFLYFEKESDDVAQIRVNSGNVSIQNEMLVITDARNGGDFAVYAPAGSTWTQNGSVYTSTLNGQNYWSMAMIPLTAANVTTVATEYKKYAYVFPTNTVTSWTYDSQTGKVETNFQVTTTVKEGANSNMLLGLLPHQWDNLAPQSPVPDKYSYAVVRGELKTMEGNSFSVQNTFKGILPTLPYVANYSNGFDPSKMDAKISQIENDGLATWTDSYNEGQVMNRLIQTARIADQTGDTEARDKMVATIKERLEDWLTYQSGEKAFLFYYNSNWSTLIGYPAGHGQDGNINDHHFHWGYFIHAAAFMEQFQPGWASEWGDMVNHLVRDAASPDRSDAKFPFLRNFSPYAGHCWANGFASFSQGNDQESTSESMQFNSSLIHWGTITGNDEIRDLGIYLYTTEQTAIEEYWLDVYERNFKPSQAYSLVSRVWGNAYDNGTFWTSDIAASYGIELYPIHGGSLYLGHNAAYAEKLWQEISANTGILSNQANPNLWHDIMWQFLSLTDAQAAIDLYNSYPDRSLKFGVSDAQTYHWLHAMNALGQVDPTITADYPIAAVFNKNGSKTYVAHNYSDQEITVTFSDGGQLLVAPRSMSTNVDVPVSGVISSSFNQAYPNGSVQLSVSTQGEGVTKVAFYDGDTYLGEDVEAPYEWTANNLALGVRGMYARVYLGENFSVTNIVAIQVGEQVPYSGTPHAIPGTIEGAHYDTFEGGLGQGIAYFDGSANNEGDFRTDEYVDAAQVTSEGATVGWIASGEWLEYTVQVENAGLYDLAVRYASGNAQGGGPFYLEIDGVKISPDISLASTSSTNWNTWVTKTVNGVEFNKGTHVVRLVAVNGEFNLGKMTFTLAGSLPYSPPVAHAGSNVLVVLPETTAQLDGSLSSDPTNDPLTFSWQQLYGPSIAVFDDNTLEIPTLSNLQEGIYKFKLTVSDGQYTSTSQTLVIVSQTQEIAPSVSITSPTNNASFKEGEVIAITAVASDLDGTISLVEFFDGDTKIGQDGSSPYTLSWTGATIGNHAITAKATDNGGTVGTSSVVNITVNEVKSCVVTSANAQQGAFNVGYKATFESAGANVKITFELLDTDKTGVEAVFWKQSPFTEIPVTRVSGNIFTTTIGGLTQGTTISYACKFAFSGGQAVTNYIQYQVGSDCSGSNDTSAPTGFTALVGAITQSSVQLLLNATDNSGKVVYTVIYGSKTATVTGDSGVEKALVITSLTPSTSYSFSVRATDLAGNVASNNPIVLTASTTVDTNTDCIGSLSSAQQGSFNVGYNYEFQTVGSNVEITFELLDDKSGVLAFLWQESPFTEIQMTNVSGKKFTHTLTGQTPGTTLRLGCKFAFAGGLAVTKYFSYKVGETCNPLGINETTFVQNVYPNPVQDEVTISLTKEQSILDVKLYDTIGKLYEVNIQQIGDERILNLSGLNKGLYLLVLSNDQTSQTIKIYKE
jgi:endoglucanase Acf2